MQFARNVAGGREARPAFALRFRSGSGRAFFVVPAEAHREVLRERALRLMRNGCWARHFELYGPDGTD